MSLTFALFLADWNCMDQDLGPGVCSLHASIASESVEFKITRVTEATRSNLSAEE
jgi:hypothetical protein